MTNKIAHQAIAASAGSGKTFQLSLRYIKLLSYGVHPDRIVALTFSRKAAGEIFDSIIRILRLAVTSKQLAQGFAEQMNHPQLEQSDFLMILRNVLSHLHRLNIGTVDSFIVSILRCFPIELGIPSSFQIMENDSASARSLRQHTLNEIFTQSNDNYPYQKEFFQAFKQATYGKEEKGLEQNIDSFITTYRKYFQILPFESAWGDSIHIWPEGTQWFTESVDINSIADELLGLLMMDELPEKAMMRWQAFLHSVRRFSIHSSWNNPIDYMTKKLIEAQNDLQRGDATISIDRYKCHLSSEESHLALQLLSTIIQTEITGALYRTRGIFRLLSSYEQKYENAIYKEGKLTFDDAQYLLVPGINNNSDFLYRHLPGSDHRMYIDYRLDTRLDHWLIDEFQDTSDLQWQVLENLVDEIMQDPSGDRSFFYVGDIKQAIYGWRGGNAQLFSKILSDYPDRITQNTLSTSFRSAQPIIDTINRIFGRLPSNLPHGTIKRWEDVWDQHNCESDFVPEDGYAALLEPITLKGGKPAEKDRHLLVSRLINEIDPLRRGLSSAILVRTNESGRRIVDYLRNACPNLSVSHEGKATIKDNPVVSLILSLIQFAAHPGDNCAWRHLNMSPLNTYFQENGHTRSNLPALLLRQIQTADGLQNFIQYWGAILDAMHPLDEFGHKRLDDLINAATEYDIYNKPDCNDFLSYIDSYQIHETASDEAVRVMTIHQSKGLGFDIVILPDLQSEDITRSNDNDFVLARDPDSLQPLWAFQLPRKRIAEADATLAHQVSLNDEKACFDALCLLYVSLTRAKCGLYMISSLPGNSSKMLTSASLLKTQLINGTPAEGVPIYIDEKEFTCLFETGSRYWYRNIEKRDQSRPTLKTVEVPHFLEYPSQRLRITQIRPSEETKYSQPAGRFFHEDYYKTRQTGTAIHQLLSEVQWLDEVDTKEIMQEWQRKTTIDDSLIPLVLEHFRNALQFDSVRQALSYPGNNAQLWRERSFDIVLDQQWISGIFDRVMIVRDSNHKIQKTALIDFKTDEIDDSEEYEKAVLFYRPQVFLYRRVLAHMLSISASDITSQLLFTRNGRLVNID